MHSSYSLVRSIAFTLPWTSFTANNRNGYGNGRVYNSPAYKAYKAQCYALTRSVVNKHLKSPIDFPVISIVWLYPPDNRRRDWDNYVKPIHDVITYCGIWVDDSICHAGNPRMCPKDSNPRIDIEIIPDFY